MSGHSLPIDQNNGKNRKISIFLKGILYGNSYGFHFLPRFFDNLKTLVRKKYTNFRRICHHIKVH